MLNLCFSQEKEPSSKRIDSLFNFIDNDGPGVSIGIVKDGDLVYTYQKGLSNLEYEIPISSKTVFGLASITKQMTAACIGVLVKNGKLDVNDDVRKYIPELPNYGSTIKIKHLLNHTSGLRNHNVLLDLQGFDYEHMGYTNESIQKLIFSQNGVNNQPGDKMLYANSNYVLLALIIERVSGDKIDVYAKKELFEPLGMTQTFFKSSLEQIIKNKAYSYYKKNNVYVQAKSLTHCIGAGGVLSTIDDMAKWSKLFTDRTPELPYLPQFISTLDTLNNGDYQNYARGVFVSPYKNQKTINHSGRDIGMRSQLICLPKANLSVIIFTNSEHINVVNLSYKVLDLFIASSENKKQNRNEYIHSKTELLKFTGDYQEINSDLGMKILFENDTLKAKSSFGRTPIPLKENGKHEFHRKQNSSVKYHFFNDESSKYDLVVDFGGAKFYFERVQLEHPDAVNLNDYIGEYYSSELNVTYQVFIENQKMFLSLPNNPKVKLTLGQENEFGSGKRTRYIFKRDKNKVINSFTVASEGTVKDILFQKIN
ncbi:MAG: serine hydrolase domain-containing protein [Flavobacteriaceae bacterium]